MKRLAGQAGRIIGFALHRLGLLVLTIVSLLILAFCVLAFRLSLGPVQIPYLASELASAASGQGIDVRIKRAALAWAGYKEGGGTPLYLQLADVSATNATGVLLARTPDARLVFLPSALLGSKAPILVNSSHVHFNGSDVAVSLRAAISLGIGFQLSQAELLVTLGPGRAGAGGTSEPITGGGFAVHLTPHDVSLSNGELNLTPSGGSAPVLLFAGAGHLDNLWTGALTITADKVQAADLANYWPPQLAAQARHWVTTNITSGTAHGGKFVVTLSAPRNLSRISLVAATGGFAGDNLTLSWIPGARPITGLFGRLALQDRDTILITADRAMLGGMQISSGTMKITGVSQRDQTGIVAVAIGGAVADAIAVLNAPPLNLLRGVPDQLAQTTGNVTANIATTLPLKNKLRLSDVALTVDATLSNVAVPTPVAGLAFSAGQLSLHATTKTLAVTGRARLAGETAAIAAQAAFSGLQPLRRFELKTALGPVLLHRLGLDAETAVSDAVSGVVPVDLVVAPDGKTGQLATLSADLTPAELGVPVLGWAKRAGRPGRLKIIARISDGNLAGFESVTATAPALAISGVVNNGNLQLNQIAIGRTVGQGEVVPPSKGAPWRITLHGQMLDVRAILTPAKGEEAKQAAPSAAPPSGPAWQANLDFAGLALAAPPAPALRNFIFSGGGRGGSVLSAEAHAMDAAGLPVVLTIKPVSADGARRGFHLQAQDGGNLLRVLAAFDNVQGGALVIDGTYGAGAAFIGTTSLAKFRLLQAPALGKILQAVTVYGAAEAVSGPGLVFSRLEAPFTISRQVLTLNQARAYSASLGFTASGTIGLADGNADLDTTIIPAYALNTLPGKIPLIGRLFRAEKGGGLFALRAKITGQLTNPSVRVNPLSVLTPGALRGVFGAAPKGPK